MRRSLIGIILLLVASTVCLAQAGDQLNSFSSELPRGCNLAGTWIGGSDPQFAYQVTLTPVAALLGTGGYSIVAQQALDWSALGIIDASNWTGMIERTGPGAFRVYMMSMYRLAPETAAAVGADPALPEVDAVRGHVKFLDCDTLTIAWDVYYVYFGFDAVAANKVPFVTPPDFDVLGGTNQITETYHRLPRNCPVCSAGQNVGMATFANPIESRKSRVPGKR